MTPSMPATAQGQDGDGLRQDGLTQIERVRLALAMADAGYEVDAEYVEALLSAYDTETAALQARVGELTKALEKIHQFPYVGFNASREMALIAGSALSRQPAEVSE